MGLENFRIREGDNGLEFVEFVEKSTKTRPGGLNAKPRQFQPKMFQTSGERCSVALLRQYINRRPRNLKASGPFYLSIKYKSGPGDKTWFKVQPMGENKNNSMMKTSSPKQPFSHLRSGLPITVPAKRLLARWRKQISRGHPLQKSLVKEINDYDEADEDKKQQLSWAILIGSSKPNQCRFPLQTALSNSTSNTRPRLLNYVKDDSISSKVIRTQTEQLLNCLTRLWTFLHLKDFKISFYLIVLIVCSCFDQTHNVTARLE